MKASKRTRDKRAAYREMSDRCRAIIFGRDGHRCVYCHAERGKLDWHHVHSRRFLVTRFDPDNGLVLCVGCHGFAHDHSRWFADWFDSTFPERARHLDAVLAESRDNGWKVDWDAVRGRLGL